LEVDMTKLFSWSQAHPTWVESPLGGEWKHADNLSENVDEFLHPIHGMGLEVAALSADEADRIAIIYASAVYAFDMDFAHPLVA
jgi:hypothetical protein